jgi:hypothetical protein
LQHDEFVTAKARYKVLWTREVAKSGSESDEKSIARVVTQPIIYVLEVVDIDVVQGDASV